MPVLVSDDDRIRTLLLSRPERLNAFDGSLIADLTDALTAAADDPDVAVVVISGEGRAFSTGADLKALANATPPEGDDSPGFTRLLELLLDLPKPLLMAVNGFAVGFGMTMLAYADLVFVSTEARLRCPFAELGAAPEAGSSYLFPRLLGRQEAAWILLSSAWLTGADAHRIGLAWKLCEPDELLDVTYEHARVLAAHGSAGLATTRRLLADIDRAELSAAIVRENEAMNAFIRRFATGS